MPLMDNDTVMVNGTPTPTPRNVFYNGSDALSEGMALCYDLDNATVANQRYYCVKPTLSLISRGAFAGFVAPGQKLAASTQNEIGIIPWDGQIFRGAQVLTDENVSSGDFLGPVPETYYFGRCVVNTPVFRVGVAVDGTTTPALCTGDYGRNNFGNTEYSAKKCVRYVDEFLGLGGFSATADAATYNLVGTGATAVFQDAFGPDAAAGLAAQNLRGVVAINALTSGFEATANLNGEPFRMDAGKSLFCMMRVAAHTATSGQRAFFGLALGASTDLGDATGTDYMGFRMLAGVLDFIYGKAVTSSALQTATGGTSATIAAPTVVADTFVELAFMVRNKKTGTSAGNKELTIWASLAGSPLVQIAHTAVLTNICDNQSLTLAFAADDSGGSTNQTIYLDFVEIVNYVG